MQPQIPTTPSMLSFFPTASLESVLAVVITLIFIWWLIFTLVVIFHWWKYSRESAFTVPAIALHIFVSGWLFAFATGALH